MRMYSHRYVTRKGKKDGRDWKWQFWPLKDNKPREPKSDQQIVAHFEDELLRATEAQIAKEAEDWKKTDQKLKPRYCEAVSKLKEAKEIETRESNEAQQAEREFEKAKRKYQQISLPSLSAGWRNFWLILISIGEFPLNSVVFSLFGASRMETYLMAAIICIVIPLGAHFFGKSLHQNNKTKTDIVLLIIVPIIVLSALGSIAYIRSQYFETIQTLELLGINMSPTTLTILFILLNILIFLIAVLVSYEGSHTNHSLYNTINKRYRQALRTLRKEAEEAEVAGKLLAKAEIAYQNIRHYRKKSHEKFLQDITTIQENGEWLISSYRAANLRVRPDIPLCFQNDARNPELPNDIINLDWECEELKIKEQ